MTHRGPWGSLAACAEVSGDSVRLSNMQETPELLHRKEATPEMNE